MSKHLKNSASIWTEKEFFSQAEATVPALMSFENYKFWQQETIVIGSDNHDMVKGPLVSHGSLTCHWVLAATSCHLLLNFSKSS